MKRLILLTLLCAGIQQAPGVVVWSGFDGLLDIPIPVSTAGGSVGDEIYLPIGGGTAALNADYTSHDVAFSFGGFLIRNSSVFQPARNGAGNTDAIRSLALGTLVDSSLSYATGNGVSDGHLGSGPDQFPNGGTGYLGFAWTSEGLTRYGWMELMLTNNQDDGAAFDPTVVQWAYESQPGTPIQVGTIPEPGSVLLAVLGAGHLLLVRRRR
jgi:MYXO-CTERM domain-containing protein